MIRARCEQAHCSTHHDCSWQITAEQLEADPAFHPLPNLSPELWGELCIAYGADDAARLWIHAIAVRDAGQVRAA